MRKSFSIDINYYVKAAASQRHTLTLAHYMYDDIYMQN